MTDLRINKVVMHALIKEQHQRIQPSQLRQTVLNRAHDAVGKTVSGVIGIYGTRNNSAHYGIFESGEGRGSFPSAFDGYARLDEPTDAQFLELTQIAMGRLYDKASANHAASGGYLLFADYSNTQGRYFLIAMIKQKPGITLTDRLEPTELMQLDLAKLNQAARISFSRLSEYHMATEDAQQELNYLSFVSPGSSKTASGYFVTALGCSQGAAASQATKNLIRETRQFFSNTDGLRPNKEAFNNSLLEYLKDKEEARESVRLSEIEHIVRRHIPDQLADQADSIADELITHLNSENCGIPTEFPVSASALKRFTHISGQSSYWKMAFDRLALGEDEAAEVYYDRESGKLVLRNIPGNMRESIEQELATRSEE